MKINTLKYRILFALLCCCFSILCYAQWQVSTPAQILPLSNSYTVFNVYVSCDSTTGKFLATWNDYNNNNYPSYSFYTPGSGWSDVRTITELSQARLDIVTSCNPTTGQFLATWTDFNTNHSMYSIYTPGSGWQTAAPISTTITAQNTNNSFDSLTGKFLATWANFSNHDYPTYSFYTPGTGWSDIATITTSSPAANVSSSFNSSNGEFLAVWVDIGTGQPMYSFYMPGSGWESHHVLADGTDVANDIFCACDPTTGQFLATWADINASYAPYYSLYTPGSGPGSGWTAFDIISTASNPIDNVRVSCDPTTGQFLATWDDYTTAHPTYAFYTLNTGWAAASAISTTLNYSADTITCFNPTTGEFLATWAGASTGDIHYPDFAFFSIPSIYDPTRLKTTCTTTRNRAITILDNEGLR